MNNKSMQFLVILTSSCFIHHSVSGNQFRALCNSVLVVRGGLDENSHIPYKFTPLAVTTFSYTTEQKLR